MHLALDVVSEHLTAEPKENLFLADDEPPAEAALLAFSAEEEEEGMAVAAAAAMDDLRALLTRETLAGGKTGDTEPMAPELGPDAILPCWLELLAVLVFVVVVEVVVVVVAT